MARTPLVSWTTAACRRVSAHRAEPFDGGDDALGEAAGDGHREISGAGRDRPADGEAGPPSDHKIIPPADIEERQRPAYDKNDDGGDHDRKDESCLPTISLSEPLRGGTRQRSKVPRQLYRLSLSRAIKLILSGCTVKPLSCFLVCK